MVVLVIIFEVKEIFEKFQHETTCLLPTYLLSVIACGISLAEIIYFSEINFNLYPIILHSLQIILKSMQKVLQISFLQQRQLFVYKNSLFLVYV